MGSRDGVDDDFDLELEVSDLRRAPSADAPHAGQWAGAREGSAQEGADDRGTSLDALDIADAAQAQGTPLEVDGTSMARAIERTAWRPVARLLAARRTRGYAVAVLVLLVCAGLLLSLPDTQQALRQTLVRPTPTPTQSLAFGANLVAFEYAAPWGRLTLDGTPKAPQFSQFGQFTPLSRGRHTLTYAAAPWPVLHCQLSVPAQQGDSCPVDSTMQGENEQPLARVIELGATPERLPAVQRAALTAAVANTLQASVETTTVPPGDHYRAADGHIAVATQPMQASLVLTLNTDAAPAASNFGPGPCVSLCSQPFGGFDGGAAGWVVWAVVVAHWQFMAADGTLIDPGASTDLDAPYPVGATWSESPSGLGAGGGWSVTAHPYAASPGAAGVAGAAGGQGDLCFPAFQQAFPNGTPLLSSTSGFSEESHPGPSEIAGCVMVVSPISNGGEPLAPNATPNAAAATPTPLPAGTAIFIVRFGIVLAGNAVAHTAQPLLPVASAHERALAQQWMTQPQP
jgi:hypothetical protein